MTPQRLVRSTARIRALDEHGREVVRDLGRRRSPDGDVPWFDGHAVRLDVAKEDEFVLGRDMLDEKARALIKPRFVLAMTDRHIAHRDVGEYRLVFAVGVEADSHNGSGGHTVSSDIGVFGMGTRLTRGRLTGTTDPSRHR